MISLEDEKKKELAKLFENISDEEKEKYLGKPGVLYGEDGSEYTVEEWLKKQKIEKLKETLLMIKNDGRSNKERIRDFVIQKVYATRFELVHFFTNKNDLGKEYQVMSEKTLDNNLKKLKEEKTLILSNKENLQFVYNVEKPFIPTQNTSESTLRAYHILKQNRNISEEKKRHYELKKYLMNNMGYKIYYKGEEDEDFYFSNTNMHNLSIVINDLLYKCFLGNPDLFYRFRKKEDFYFSILITVNLDKEPKFKDFFEKYYEMKEVTFRNGFPTEASKIKSKKDIEDFVKHFEERQRALAKYQHEKRDRGIEKILNLPISNKEKNLMIQNFLRELELEVYSKFSILRT